MAQLSKECLEYLQSFSVMQSLLYIPVGSVREVCLFKGYKLLMQNPGRFFAFRALLYMECSSVLLYRIFQTAADMHDCVSWLHQVRTRCFGLSHICHASITNSSCEI